MTTLMLCTALLVNGGLLSERVPQAGALLGATPDVVGSPALEKLTAAELITERERVVATLPGIVPGVVGLALGAGGFTVGVGVFLFAGITIGGVIMGVSALVVVAGIIWFLATGAERAEGTKRLREIDAAMKRLATPRRMQDDTPPPPPPPGVMLGPTPGWVVIR